MTEKNIDIKTALENHTLWIMTYGVEGCRADLSGSNLSGANLIRANLSGSDLSGSDFSGSNLIGADLSHANLSRANISRANLSRANISRANLSGSDLSGSNLIRANLSHANLSRANLSRANISRANISRANLSRANLKNAHLDPSILSSNLSYIDLPDNVTIELMRRDAWCHENPIKFDEWAKGGPCPYDGSKISRKHFFVEKRELWQPGPPQMRDYDLIMAISESAGWQIEG